MAQLVIFAAGTYPSGQEGFLEAKKDGALQNVNIDENSYTMLYNVQQSITATERCLGLEVHLGAYQDDVFVSMSEMDDLVHGEGGEWESIDEAFERVLEVRKLIGYDHAQLALDTYKKSGIPCLDIDFSFAELAKIGKQLEDGFKENGEYYLFDRKDNVWYKQDDPECRFDLDPKTGLPVSLDVDLVELSIKENGDK